MAASTTEETKILTFPTSEPTEINVTSLTANTIKRRLDPSLLSVTPDQHDDDVLIDHTAEPIKDVATIDAITAYLIAQGRYRDNMLFVCGINFGLRISDLLTLRFSSIIDDTLTFKTTFPVLEKKTRNTRKRKANRYITINDAVIEAVTLYLQHTTSTLDDFLFRSESNRCTSNQPLSRMSVDRILKGIKEELGLSEKISSHTLRKTFGYHQMLMSGNDPRKLMLLQKIFGHSTAAQTLQYIGITEEEIEDAYMNLNLGGTSCYDRFSKVFETTYTA